MDFKLPKRFENSNKSFYGRVLNVAGSDYMPGAAYLSSVSALKIGCGYCFLCSTEKVIASVAAKTSNVVFLPIDRLREFISSVDVVEIGCGLSQDNRAVEMFKITIESIDSSTPILIDADGLNILAKNFELFSQKELQSVVLTPHPKEAARLLDWSLESVLSNVEFAAKQISDKYNCVTVLKTHNTYICSSDGRDYQNFSGNNAMAKAGSGDVLTGMISGLLAQGMNTFEASCLGVYLHGVCGDIAKNRLTEYSVMADDLISTVPDAINYYIQS